MVSGPSGRNQKIINSGGCESSRLKNRGTRYLAFTFHARIFWGYSIGIFLLFVALFADFVGIILSRIFFVLKVYSPNPYYPHLN